MNEALAALVVERLSKEALDDDAASCVLASLEGAGPLDSLLGSETGIAAPPPPPPPQEAAPTPGATLSSIAVQGFRGIGPRATLKIDPGPGLTLVVGRNGSGKSSFAEGLEVLLTGENLRWRDRTKVWREGWRNLHAGDEVAVEATVSIEGDPKPTTIARTWTADADLGEGEAFVQRAGDKRAPLSSLGWEDALVAFRPFLSYNELGSMLDEGPSKLYDALASILGLEDLVAAQNVLRDARLARERLGKDAKTAAASLTARLEDVEDDRAAEALKALNAKDVDLLEQIATGTGGDQPSDDLDTLAAITIPTPGEVVRAADALNAAHAAVEQIAGTDAERDRQTAELLDKAIAFHEGHGDTGCPVCGVGALDAAWRSSAVEQVASLRASAQRASDAHEALSRARPSARALLAPMLDALPAEGRAEWEARTATDAGDLLATYDALKALVEPVVAKARAARAQRDAAWTPIATDIAAYVEQVRDARAAETAVKPLKAAETWLKNAAASIRDERFAPIANKVASNWETLRQQSSIELGKIGLAGAGTQRRVTLDVTIDGVDGAALGVMSQGELHALALSLFLPRATLPESPFRFIVVDDPVQSMDPSRVDGLARVLEDTARDRQVVVFTHDDRLPEATRRLGIAATIIEVSRRPNSAVELREATDPVQRLLSDAFAVAKSTDRLPERVAPRVVPGLCRIAFETACLEIVRRRRLSRGVPHAEVEQLWDRATTTNLRAALALFDDTERSGEVMKAMNAIGRDVADAYRACKEAGHEPYKGDLVLLARGTEKLCKELRRL